VLPKPGHEVAEGREVPHEPLNVLDVPNLIHFGDGRNLIRVCFDASLDDDVPQELALGDSEGAFFWVQLDAESLEVVEGFLQVGNEVAALSRLRDDVIDVDVQVAPYLLFEAELHTPLVRSPYIL
jgi:hypothetical protein